jgi:hypothetical protein
VEIRALIACGTRAELQADFNRTRDQRDRQIAAAQSAFIAQNQAASARQQAQQDRIMAGLNASIARSHADLNASIAQDRTDSKLDEISQGVRALRLGE